MAKKTAIKYEKICIFNRMLTNAVLWRLCVLTENGSLVVPYNPDTYQRTALRQHFSFPRLV